MKLTLKIARLLAQLTDGESIPASAAKSKLMEVLIAENIIFQKGKHRKTLQLLNASALSTFLINQLQINNLQAYISALESESSSRAQFVKISTDSKHSKERAFKGFLVNSYQIIKAELNNEAFIVNPTLGSFIFISDYETFKIPREITIVGIENAKNFSQIREQQYLFEDIIPLFVSRYPQNQNKDFIKWMKSIPNDYLHFGDLDMAGIGIYLNEYKKHLSQKTTFFIPENIGTILRKNGNRERFDKQKPNFKSNDITESNLLDLLEIINLEKKGLDQEYFIGAEPRV